MDVTLRPELPKLIEDQVKSGRSDDPSDFLNKAVYQFVLARDLGHDFTQPELDQTIGEGLDDTRRGDTIDSEEAFLQLRAYATERRQYGGRVIK